MKPVIAAVAILAIAGVVCMGAGFLHRILKGRGTAGEWTGPFTAAEYEEFVGLVRQHFRTQGLEVTISDGYVTVAGTEERPRYGLGNVAQACRLSERSEWPAIISEHFAALLQAQADELDSETLRDFSQVSSLLAVRLWPEDYVLEAGAEGLVYRQDLEGTVSYLVYDLPHSVWQVRSDQAEAWGKPTEALFELGLANVRRMERPKAQPIDLGEGLQATALYGETFYVATEALLLDDHPKCTGAHGALVAVPTRHVLLCFPIEGPDVTTAIGRLALAADGLYRDGPGSITPNLYWYHDGRFTNLPYELREGKVIVSPPAEFARLLDRLEEGGAGGD